MKKLFMVLAFVGMTMTTMAQDFDPVQKYSVVTNSFWSNWFIQVGADWNAFYSDQEHGRQLDLSHSPFKDYRSHVGAAVAIGKWFTPGLGLRTKLQGIWGKRVYDPNDGVIDNDIKYWTLNEHILFNLSNMLCGYNSHRFWNFIPFAGGGISRNMSDNFYAMQLSAGLLNTFRISNKVQFHVEAGWNRLEDDFDGRSPHGGLGHSARGWEDKDNNLYAELGLTFNLGKATFEKAPDVDAIKALSQSQIDALTAQLNDANAENARLKNLLANQKPATTQTIREFVTAPVNVYFNLDKTTTGPNMEGDLQNVRQLVEVAKSENAGVLVAGYADSATGKADHNVWLADKRAEFVADKVVEMGMSRDKIETVGKGGVAILSPINLDRRVTVEIKK